MLGFLGLGGVGLGVFNKVTFISYGVVSLSNYRGIVLYFPVNIFVLQNYTGSL